MSSRLVSRSPKTSSRRLKSPFTCIRAGAVAVATGAAGGTGDVACAAGAGSQPNPNPQSESDMITVPSSRSTRAPLLVDLALQGGGSHGAFTWGVLDRLLEEPWLRIEGISGTSAGAMNAAVLVDGHAEGGADGARARLELFWKRVSDGARFSPFRRSPLDILLGRWTLDTSPLFLAFDLMARVFSPYDLNPRGVNPLTGILADCIDFKRVARAPIKLFVTATNVRTGRGRVFRNAELTPDVLLASAGTRTQCLAAALPALGLCRGYPENERGLPKESRRTGCAP